MPPGLDRPVRRGLRWWMSTPGSWRQWIAGRPLPCRGLLASHALHPARRSELVTLSRSSFGRASSGGLFSAPVTDRASPGSHSATIPEQVVGADGAITVPYAGRIQVAGKTTQAVEQRIVDGLAGKAVEPQALVTVTKNIANTVTVIGEGHQWRPRAVDHARRPNSGCGRPPPGGQRRPCTKLSSHSCGDGRSVRIPMQAVLSNPQENVPVRPGDVIIVAREPQTFTAAGATGQNNVIPFDAIGITLDQAIGRAGGLADYRADPAGVFVIRYEAPAEYDQLGFTRPSLGPLAQVPVIYRINFRDPGGFFLARRFPIRNKDIVFVSNAPVAQFQKVMNLLFPIHRSRRHSRRGLRGDKVGCGRRVRRLASRASTPAQDRPETRSNSDAGARDVTALRGDCSAETCNALVAVERCWLELVELERLRIGCRMQELLEHSSTASHR